MIANPFSKEEGFFYDFYPCFFILLSYLFCRVFVFGTFAFKIFYGTSKNLVYNTGAVAACNAFFSGLLRESFVFQ